MNYNEVCSTCGNELCPCCLCCYNSGCNDASCPELDQREKD